MDSHCSKVPINSFGQYWVWTMVEDDVLKEPFVIGLYFGSRKPSSTLEFLHDFVEEAKVLQERGIVYENRIIPFTLSAIICDTSA